MCCVDWLRQPTETKTAKITRKTVVFALKVLGRSRKAEQLLDILAFSRFPRQFPCSVIFDSLTFGVDPGPANAEKLKTWTAAYWEALHPHSPVAPMSIS